MQQHYPSEMKETQRKSSSRWARTEGIHHQAGPTRDAKRSPISRNERMISSTTKTHKSIKLIGKTDTQMKKELGIKT